MENKFLLREEYDFAFYSLAQQEYPKFEWYSQTHERFYRPMKQRMLFGVGIDGSLREGKIVLLNECDDSEVHDRFSHARIDIAAYLMRHIEKFSYDVEALSLSAKRGKQGLFDLRVADAESPFMEGVCHQSTAQEIKLIHVRAKK